MPPSTPFVDPRTGTIDRTRLLVEAVLVGKLVGLFVALAIVPFGIATLLGPFAPLSVAFAVIGQFVLAIGAAIVLMHVIVRAIRLAG